MARRRVNTRFLMVVTFLIVGGGAAALLVPKVMDRGSVRRFIEAGDAALPGGDPMKADKEQLAEAIEQYRQALRLDPQNLELMVRFGDLLHAMSRHDEEYIGSSVMQWERVLERDPTNTAALERLVREYAALAEIRPREEAINPFARLKDRAAKLSQAQPRNAVAEGYVYVGTIGSWALRATPTPEGEITGALQALRDVIKKAPDRPEFLYYIGVGYNRLAQDRTSARRPDEARQFRQTAMEICDEVTAAQPDNAAAHYKAYLVAALLGGVEEGADPAAEHLAKLRERITRAAATVKPGDRDYSEIHTTAAMLMVHEGRAAEAEQYLRQLLEKRPGDVRLRLALAQLLRGNRARRAEAVELLTKGVEMELGEPGYRARMKQEMNLRRLMELTSVQLDLLGEAKDAAEQSGLRAQIESNLNQITAMIPEDSPLVLKLRGRLLLTSDDEAKVVEAIQMLQRSLDKNAQNQMPFDTETAYYLCYGYASRGQSGQAKRLAQQIVERRPTFSSARKMLASLLIGEGTSEARREAAKHVDILEQETDDPEVILLRLGTLDRKKDAEQIRKLVSMLPDGDESQKMVKARAAIIAEDLAQAEAVLRTMPTNPQAVELLCLTVLRKQERLAEAAQIAAEAAKALPDDARLARLVESLRTLAQRPMSLDEQQAFLTEDFIKSTRDPVLREVRWYEYLRGQGKIEEAYKHLEDAERQLKPDDTRNRQLVMSARFAYLLEKKLWVPAKELLDQLKASNADQANGLLFEFRYHLAREDMQKALETAKLLTRQRPEFSRSWLALGQANQMLANATGDVKAYLDAAVDAYRRALDAQSDSADAIRGLIECHLKLGRPDLAKRYITRATEAFPNSPYFKEQQLSFEEQYGDAEKALAERERILATSPDVMRAWLGLAASYARVAELNSSRGQTVEAARYLARARETLDEAIRKWPDEKALYGYLAEALMRAKQPEEGLAVLQKLAGREAWKNKPDVPLMLGSYLARMENRTAEAEKAYLQAVSLSGDSPAARQQLAQFYRNTRQWDKAEAEYVRLTKDSPEPKYFSALAHVRLQSNRPQDALTTAEEGLARFPDDDGLREVKLLSLVTAKKIDEANRAIERMLTANPKDATALYYRGMIRFEHTEDWEGAVKDLEAAREARPGNVEIRKVLAEVLKTRRDFARAAAELDAALKLDPLRKDVRLQLVECYRQMQQWLQAERVINEAKSNSQLMDDPVWWQVQGRLLKQRKDVEGALKELKKAVDMDPTNAELLYDYLEYLHLAGQHRQVLYVCGQLMKNERLKDQWWLHRARARALSVLPDGDKEVAMQAFETAVDLAGKRGFDPSAMVIPAVVDAMGLESTISRVSKRAERDLRWKIILADLHLQKQQYATAIEAIDPVLEALDQLSPTEQEMALRTAGTVYIAGSAGRADYLLKAADLYRRLIDLIEKNNVANPMTRMTTFNNMAVLLSEAITPPQPKQAIQYSERAVKAMRAGGLVNPTIMDTHGWLLVLNGRADEGIALLREAADRAQAEGAPLMDAHYHLGLAYLGRQQLTLAVQHLDKAHDLAQKQAARKELLDPAMLGRIQEALQKARESLEKAGGVG